MDSHVNSARYWDWVTSKRKLPFLRRSLRYSLNSTINSSPRDMEEATGQTVSRKRRRLNHDKATSENAEVTGAAQVPMLELVDNSLEERFFEIEVLEILSLSPAAENQRSRVRCIVTLYYPEVTPFKDGRPTPYSMCYFGSQIGIVQTTVDDAGHATTKVHLPEPFRIPLHQVCVNDPKPAPDGSEEFSYFSYFENPNEKFGMTRNYALQIRLERLGVLTPWPPLQLQNVIAKDGQIARMLSTGNGSNEPIKLFAKGDDLLLTQTAQQKLDIGVILGEEREMTGHQLVVNVRWSFPAFPSWENTESTGNTENTDDEMAVITYKFEDQQSQKEKVLHGFKCIFCLEDLHTQQYLLYHLTTHHASWQFSMKKNSSSPSAYSVSVKQSLLKHSSNLLSKDATLQLGPPKAPFDLDKYIGGDKSWISNRKGMNDHSGLATPTQSSISPSQDSQMRSPTSSQHTNIDVDMEEDPSYSTGSTRRKPVVPKTDRPIYDILTKRVLVPGEEFSDSEDDQIIDSLSRKHVDVINDFSDVSDDEKDYIIRWDHFIKRQNVTAHCYFAPALLKFLEESSDWFREKDSRPRQFGLHLTKLVLEGSIIVADMAKCTMRLREIRQAGAQEPVI